MEIEEDIGKYKPVELRGFNAKLYPWFREDNLNDWEYKLVKIKGYFKEQRFFVRRKRDNKEGYLVFAPFITAREVYDTNEESPNYPAEFGLMVNLGWVPLDNKNDI
jgi:surfeit locus 1 family protein